MYILFSFIVHRLLKNNNVSQYSHKVLQPFATGSSCCHSANFLMTLFTLFPTVDINLKESRHHVVQFSSVIACPLTFLFPVEINWKNKHCFSITCFRSRKNKMEIKTLTYLFTTPTFPHIYVLPIIPVISAHRAPNISFWKCDGLLKYGCDSAQEYFLQ